MIDTTINVCSHHTIQFSKYTDCTICNLLFYVEKLLDGPDCPAEGSSDTWDTLRRIIKALKA